MAAPTTPFKPYAPTGGGAVGNRTARIGSYNASPAGMEAKRKADVEIAKIQPQLDAMRKVIGKKTGGKVSAGKSAGKLAAVAKKANKPVMAKKSGGCTTRW